MQQYHDQYAMSPFKWMDPKFRKMPKTMPETAPSPWGTRTSIPASDEQLTNEQVLRGSTNNFVSVIVSLSDNEGGPPNALDGPPYDDNNELEDLAGSPNVSK